MSETTARVCTLTFAKNFAAKFYNQYIADPAADPSKIAASMETYRYYLGYTVLYNNYNSNI